MRHQLRGKLKFYLHYNNSQTFKVETTSHATYVQAIVKFLPYMGQHVSMDSMAVARRHCNWQILWHRWHINSILHKLP